MEISQKEGFPPNSNPFLHDAYHMGTNVGRNVVIMYEKHVTEKQEYIIICNKETGERLRINFGSERK